MATDEDDARPKLAPIMLGRMGIDELEHYIGELRAEIVRAEAQIAAKRNHRSAADGFFRIN